MKFNIRDLIIGICFLIASVICIYNLIVRHEQETYYISGAVVFTVVGVAFVRKSING